MNFGAMLLKPDLTRFRFWAPALQKVFLEIENFEPLDMPRLADGWFQIDAPCGAGAAYRYRISDDLAVPDPAAFAMRGSGVDGHSLVVDPHSYRWRNSEWRGRSWHETVLYELHVGTCGGFSGVKEILPGLAELGITAVELMPINAFPGDFNWGYDGVLPYAPSSSYGTPDELKELIDTAHDYGLMMFLDVVYNHFGPEGNYLSTYAPLFFRNDLHNAWGQAIDFRRHEVRRFYTENALYWLNEFRFDGLRFDAVHAITHPDWLDETAVELRATLDPTREIHLVLENDDNVASHMRSGYFNAQWNDDVHHVLHTMLTGEKAGYYVDYVADASAKLARGMAEGFVYQGEYSSNRKGSRGTPSGDLPPSAFVLFLQNHDQIGNRALGERLTALAHPKALEAAIALQILCPQIPLLFMGEEDASTSPFLFFAQHNEGLARSIMDGRQREFDALVDADTELPDPNAHSTFTASIPMPDPKRDWKRRALYGRLLALRRTKIVPRLLGARAIDARPLATTGVLASWRMGDGAILTIASNLGGEPVACTFAPKTVIFESDTGAADALAASLLPLRTTIVALEPPQAAAHGA